MKLEKKSIKIEKIKTKGRRKAFSTYLNKDYGEKIDLLKANNVNVTSLFRQAIDLAIEQIKKE